MTFHPVPDPRIDVLFAFGGPPITILAAR